MKSEFSNVVVGFVRLYDNRERSYYRWKLEGFKKSSLQKQKWRFWRTLSSAAQQKETRQRRVVLSSQGQLSGVWAPEGYDLKAMYIVDMSVMLVKLFDLTDRGGPATEESNRSAFFRKWLMV